MATKKKFSMTQPKSAAAAYIEAQEKKEEKEKTPKKQTTQNKEQLKGTPKAQKNYERAIECFNKSLSINRTNNDAMFNKAICLTNLEKYDEAILIFSVLIKMNNKEEIEEKRNN